MTAKRIVSILLSVMMLATCVSFASAEDNSQALAGQTIIIGHIAPMTGALAAYGTAVDNAVRMAAE
jgi:ABC-type branched-subunit amino acid transport system substrate-binding protein